MIKRLWTRARRDDGLAALELLVVFPAWLVAIALMWNVFLLLSGIMVSQQKLNQIAQAASTRGCLSGEAISYAERNLWLGQHELEIQARTPAAHAYGQATFSRASVENGNGKSAACPNVVPGARFIWIEMRYRQRLGFIALNGDVPIRQTALVLSNAYTDEDTE